MKKQTAETSEVSIHQWRVFRFVREHQAWVTTKDIAKGAGVHPRTARMHAAKFVDLNIFDLAEVFPGHRYRFSEMAHKRNKNFLMRLEEAGQIFGETRG